MHNFDFIFFGFGGQISANRTGNFNKICTYTKHVRCIKTTDLMQWHGKNCILNVFLLSEREISSNNACIFLDFVHGFGSYVKGLPKTKRCNSVAVTVSVPFGFHVYVKQPLQELPDLGLLCLQKK